MNCLFVLLSLLFISEKSLNATQDGTFHRITKINGENLHSPFRRESIKLFRDQGVCYGVCCLIVLNKTYSMILLW